jgi:3-phenylpropionate/trans-cinnamate dioxygenase ferredoxin reductase subunit
MQNTMNNDHCVIIGGGHAGSQIAQSLREEGWNGDITIISNEKTYPYQRPPLSKNFLTGDSKAEDLLIRSKYFYQKLQINFLMDTEVTSINRGTNSLTLKTGSTIKYIKLILATGTQARKIPLPGADSQGVYYLRNIVDADNIKTACVTAKKAVIIGGGYMGLEIAAALTKVEIKVTILEGSSRILQRVTTSEISSFYSRVHTEEGVEILTDISVSSIEKDGQSQVVNCADGLTRSADIVIIAAGVVPSTELAETAGLNVDNGIVVNEYAQTNDPNIYAVGDCSNHYNPIYKRMIRLESVQNAVDQSKIAAAAICGKEIPYHSLPWFWSDQYDLKLQIAGLSHDFDEIFIRGSLESGRKFSAYYFKDKKFIAVDAINNPKDFMLSKRALIKGLTPDPEKLLNTNLNIQDIFKTATI